MYLLCIEGGISGFPIHQKTPKKKPCQLPDRVFNMAHRVPLLYNGINRDIQAFGSRLNDARRSLHIPGLTNRVAGF